MQANPQHSGQTPNLHEKGITPGDGTSNASGQNFYQLCLPPHSTSPSYPGQTAPGNYLTQITCSIQASTSDQILNTSVKATKDAKLAQENQFNTKHTLPTGKQDSQIILWNMPSNCQIFIPVNNVNLQVAPTNNGPNMSPCAFNSNNILYMQPQTTCFAAVPNNLQQVQASAMDAKRLNEARRNVSASYVNSGRQHAKAPPNLPKESSKKRLSLPSDLTYYPPTENTPHSNGGLFGGHHNQLMIPERSTHANVQGLSACAQRAVAVVTPLSPIGTAPVNVSDLSANMKTNKRSVGTVHHFPNIPHPLEVSVNLKNHTAEPKDPASEHQRPKSTEPRLYHGLSNEADTKSPICNDESTSQSCHASSPNVVAEQNSVPTSKQIEPSEKTTNNCTNMEKTETVPVIEWPLDRLRTLIDMIQQIEDGRSKNVQQNDAGKEIIKLYWNGDTHKFYDAVQTGIYQNIMEEVYIYCPLKEPVILRQMKTDARNKISKDFHLLKHDEEPPEMTYKSSWLNLNENVDDIDKECGYSWFSKSFQNSTEDKAQNKLRKTYEEPSLPRCKQSPTERENEVPAKEQTMDNESLHENLPVLFNGQSPPVTVTTLCIGEQLASEQSNSQRNDTNSLRVKSDVSPKSTSQSSCTTLTKLNHVVAEQPEVVSSQVQIGSSEKVPNSVVLDKSVKCLPMPKPSQELSVYTNDEETNRVDASTSKVNDLPHEMAKQSFNSEIMKNKVNATSPDKQNTTQNLDTVSTEKQTDRQRLEEKAKNSPSTLQGSLVSTPYKPSLAQHNQGTADKVSKVPVEQQMSLEKNLFNESDCGKSPPVIENCPPKVNVVEEQTGSQPNTTNSLKAMINLVKFLEQRESSLNCRNSLRENKGLKRKHQHSSTTSRLSKSFGSGVGAQSPVLTDTSSRRDYTRPSANNLLFNKNRAEGETSNKEEVAKMTASASVKMNVLPHEIPEQCFAGPLVEDKDTATQPEASLLCTPQVIDMISTKEEGEVSKSMHQQSTATSLFDDHFCNGAKSPDVKMDNSESFRINVLPHEVAKQCFASQFMEDISAPTQVMHKLANRSVIQPDWKSPPKLFPVITEPYQINNESIEEMPDIDYVLTDDSLRCEPDPRSSQELPVNSIEEKTDQMDALDSIKINVLPHKMAELWFAGEMENKISSHISNEDQVEVQDLELKFEKDVLLEDVKPKRNYKGSSNEKLESFCCLAKWFQTLECGNNSVCRCQEEGIKTKVHNTSLQMQTEEEDPNESEIVEIEDTASEGTDDSESTEDENPLPNDPTVGKTEKDILRSKEVCKLEALKDSPLKCATNVTLMHNEVEQDTQTPDLKKTSTVCLSLYGSSSGRSKAMPTKRYKGTENCEEPPETLQITIESHESSKGKRKSKNHKGVDAEDAAVNTKGRNQKTPFKNLPWRKTLPSHTVSGLGKNALSSTSLRKLLSPSANVWRDGKRKKQMKCTTQQISMNKYITRAKTLASMVHSSENKTKSKYELGNPALMPLQEGLSLEFKVLPESFNFEKGPKLNCTQSDTESQRTQNGMPVPEGDDAKRINTCHSTTQGVWSFSPLKKKQTMDVSGPCSLFQEFKKKYNEKKEIAFKQNSSSSERP